MTSGSAILSRDPETIVPHSRGESIGLSFVTQAGLASTLASAFVLVLIFRRIHKNGWSSLEALHISIMALFAAEVLHGTAHAMNLKWAIEGQAHTGTFCTAQGTLDQLGGTYASLATLTIAVQTFLIIWQLKYLSRTISVFAMGIEFLFVVLLVAIGFGIHTHPKKEYYAAPDRYWCWVGKDFLGERAGQYAWLWSALFVSLVLYFLLFLLYFGVIERGRSWYLPKVHPMPTPQSPSSRDLTGGGQGSFAGASTEAPGVLPQKDPKVLSIIFYPIAYCILVLPLSFVRWIGFNVEAKTGQSPIWPTQTLTAEFIYSLSGVVNALLYLQTRKRLFQPDKRSDPLAPGIRMARLPVVTNTGENQ